LQVEGFRTREVNDGLIGRGGVLGEIQVGKHPLVAVGSVESHFLLFPEFGVLLDRVKDRIERRRVVPVQILNNGKNPVRHGFFIGKVANHDRSGSLSVAKTSLR